MFLERVRFSREALFGKVVLITGGGGGIGFEASRAFAYMGAKVIIAEIDAARGRHAGARINSELGNENADFYEIDITDDGQIDKLYEYIAGKYGRLDILVNNAAVVPMGAVEAVPIADWDLSYAVNLRAPVMLAQKCLPAMKATGGVIMFVPSAATVPYMSGYEIFKTAQVELCNTLADEMAESPISTYAIGPGFVKTETAEKAVSIVAGAMGISCEAFYQLHGEYLFDAELAGAGFAVSAVYAQKYNGLMTTSQQVLLDAGLTADVAAGPAGTPQPLDHDRLAPLFARISDIFFEQCQSWQTRNFVQRQFILSDFKKQMGVPAEHFKSQLEALRESIQNNQWDGFSNSKELFIKLQNFYAHQKEMLQSYEKDAKQLAADTKTLNEWIDILQHIIELLP